MSLFGKDDLRSAAWGFLKSISGTNYQTKDGLAKLVTAGDLKRIQKYSDFWDFYEGYHWQKIGNPEKEAHTENWCRRFINKLVFTELNNGFRMKFNKDHEMKILPFLNGVWEDSHKDVLMQLVGQCKNVTGDGYIHVEYLEAGEFEDPYGLYPEGRIRLFAVPSSIVFPKYKDGYDSTHEALESVSIIYPVENEDGVVQEWVQYIYTRDSITVIQEGEREVFANKYGVIPIFHFKNMLLSGNDFGVSDLEDIIPLNSQLNLKNSDISEIIDYHSSPVTVVYGAKVDNLEKGANKIWGGLPEKSRVENLELKSNLEAANSFVDRLEGTMYKLAGIPEIALGGKDVNSNVSGYAITLALMPLTELIEAKRKITGEVLEDINKLIIKIGVEEGLLEGVSDIPNRDLYVHTIEFGEMIPRDTVRELEQLQNEFKLALVDRREAMIRLGKSNVEEKLTSIDKERKERPFIYGKTAVAMPSTSRLVDNETGDVLLKDEKPVEPEVDIAGQDKVQMNEKGAVGKNQRGEDTKVNSGVNNKVE